MPLAALLPFFSTLAGGYAALRLRHRLHPFMAVAAGVLVTTAVANLLPEARELVGADSAVQVGAAAVAGYLVFSLIEAFIHQTSFEHGRTVDDEGVEHAHHGREANAIAVLPPLSLIIHSTLDGLAIGLGFQANAGLGLIVLLAVLAHDFADGMNVVTLAFDAASGARLAVALLVLDALAPLFGALLSLWLAVPDTILGLLLAWFAGVFLAIGAGHLMPEAQHSDRGRAPALVGLAAIGAAIVLLVRQLAP